MNNVEIVRSVVHLYGAISFQDQERQQAVQRESEAKKREEEAFAKMEVAKRKMSQGEEQKRAEVWYRTHFLAWVLSSDLRLPGVNTIIHRFGCRRSRYDTRSAHTPAKARPLIDIRDVVHDAGER